MSRSGQGFGGLRERVEACARRAQQEVEARGTDEEGAARAALGALAAAGLLGFAVPRRLGGAAPAEWCADATVSTRALCTIRAELARHSGMLDVMFVMQGLGSFPLCLAGSPEQQEHARAAGEGRAVAAFALTEPEAGSDLSLVATRARRDGDGWRLDGAKTFISNAPLADFFSLLARTSGQPGERGGLSMFLVPRASQGITVRPFEVTAPHPIGEVDLEGVRLAAGALVGEEGGGLELALATLHRFRASVAAAATGFARRALEESLAHLARRRQFGRALASFQGLRFDLAEMDTRLRAAELLVAEAAAEVDAERPATAAVARAKLYATESASWICDRAVQHLGGRGVRRGEVVERLWREVRALRIYEGTSEVQKLILARELLERAGGEES